MAKTLKELVNEKLDNGISIEELSTDLSKLISEIVKERETSKTNVVSGARENAAVALAEYLRAIDFPITPSVKEITEALRDFEKDDEVKRLLALVSKF